MTKSQLAFWLLVIGVLMLAVAKAKRIRDNVERNGLTDGILGHLQGFWTIWDTLAIVAAVAGLSLSAKKLSAGVIG